MLTQDPHQCVHAPSDRHTAQDFFQIERVQALFGAHGGRNAPTVWNTGLRVALFWDGRASSLEEQAKGPLMNPVEMGMANSDAIVKAVQAIPSYSEKFRKAFGRPKSKTPYQVTLDDVVMAIASFERTLVTPDSPFDRFQQGDKKALRACLKSLWGDDLLAACNGRHTTQT